MLFDNLKKSIAYTLAHLLPELLPILLTLALGMPLGINSLLILSIDLLTELAPAISLASEKMEDDIMERPPRNAKTDKLVSKQLLGYSYLQAGVIESIVCLFAYFHVFLHYDIPMTSLVNTNRDYWKAEKT